MGGSNHSPTRASAKKENKSNTKSSKNSTKDTVVKKKPENSTKKTNVKGSKKTTTKEAKSNKKKEPKNKDMGDNEESADEVNEKSMETSESEAPVEKRGKKRGRKPGQGPPDTVEQKRTKLEKVSHSSLLSTGGSVLTLGEGDTGQLGLGPDTMERAKPGKVELPGEAVQVCAGGMHSVCVTTNGEVYTWGCNDEGALGRSTPDEDDCMEPRKVDLPHKVLQVCAGDSHSAALTQNGKVYAWGTFRDANGSIGLTSDGKKSEVPLEMCPDLIACRITSGSDHLACVTVDGELYTWGNAEQGQLGRVAECFSNRGGRKGLGLLLTPGQVFVKKRKTKFTNVWTGSYVTYAQTEEGDIYSTGLNNYYQLGFSDMKNRYIFERAKSFNPKLKWQEVSGGQHHAVALDGNGQVYALGRKEYGRLGLGEDVEEKAEPTLVTTLSGKKCVCVTSGSCVSFAVTETGETYAWGMGTSQQLGQKEDNDLWVPTLMTGKQLDNRSSLQVSAGGQHTIILAKDQK